MKTYTEKLKYIQIVNCGKFGYAIWDFPQTSTFYPSHFNDINEAIKEVLFNGYELVSEGEKRIIFKI